MIGITDRVTTTSVLGTFTTLGLKPPKALSDASERARKLAEGSGRLGVDHVTVEAAVSAAILAGREVTTDPDVQAAVTAEALRSKITLPESIAAAAMDVMREACLTNLDAIVGAWSKEFNKAAVTLVAAHARIGDFALDDTTSILGKGGDIADIWAGAKTADRVGEEILGGWTSLMQLVRVPLNPDHRALRLAPLSVDQWGTLPSKAKPWDLVRAGITLSLPTLDEYRARVSDINRERAGEQAASGSVDREREANKEWAARVADAQRTAVSV